MADKDFTVLLVESDAKDASAVREAFETLGLVPGFRWVSGVEAAIRYLSGQGRFSDRSRFPMPSLILISLPLSRQADFRMLRWKGEQVPEVRQIPVVELAASRQPPGFDRAYDLGAVSYLVKPIDRDALGSMVRAVIEFWRLDGRKDPWRGAPPREG